MKDRKAVKGYYVNNVGWTYVCHRHITQNIHVKGFMIDVL